MNAAAKSQAIPMATLYRAKALLEARRLCRPVETLLPLAQWSLAWWTAVHGSIKGKPRRLRSLQLEFLAMAFECGPGIPARWTKVQSAEAVALSREFVSLAAELPAPSLPAFGDHLREEARAVLLNWLWAHPDYHAAALTVGLLESGLLADDPDDDAFMSQSGIREGVVSTVSALLGMASYLAAPTGREMPIKEALLTVSAMLDALGGILDEAFALGGPKARALMESGCWERPAYPFNVADLDALAASQAREETKGGPV